MVANCFRLLLVLALATSAAVWACANGGPGGQTAPSGGERRAVTLALPRAPAADEAVVLRVRAGVLPRGARVVVRLPDGEIVGSVSPFGVSPGKKAGVYTLPLPAKVIANGKVQLVLAVEEKGQPTGRAPTEKEVEAVELAFVPVTR